MVLGGLAVYLGVVGERFGDELFVVWFVVGF